MQNKKTTPSISWNKNLFEILDSSHKEKFVGIVLLAIFVALFEVIATIFVNFSKFYTTQKLV